MVASTSGTKAGESQYVKLNPREHVLARPGMYIGSTHIDEITTWVFDSSSDKMVLETVDYIPGLFKIFDEILVNVLDHIVRLKTENTEENKKKLVKEVSITFDEKEVTITNNGEGVDIYKDETHDIYIPEMIFGNMLTSTNYDDDVDRIIGGQNGIGAKACNIYSTRFEVETVDSKRKLKYRQVFKDNMSVIEPPIIEKYTKYPFTRITFTPDFQKFGVNVTQFPPSMLKLLTKRVYDLNALTEKNIKVHLQGELLPVSTFEKYTEMYIGTKTEHPRIFDASNERWMIAASYSDNGFQQVSFVNGINTCRGGKHVDYIANQICKKLTDMIVKKKKTTYTVKPQHIKQYLFLFINSTIVNPTFDSQSKETLTTPVPKFGSKCEIDDKFIEKLYKIGIVEKAINMSSLTEDKNSKKNDGKKKSTLRGIAKLDDANYAGTSKSNQCTLILTEGDSAKTMAISGLSEVGRNTYGVFPLKGKLLNVKDISPKRLLENEEITNIKQIMGLETGKVYDNLNDLRYGKIMIMTDSDVDGSHIKGLIFNLFDHLWPSLLKMPNFITSMLTPIIKATKGKEKMEFYCLTDYENWKNEDTTNIKQWEIKYYKGLGTSSSKEAKEYFKNMKTVQYDWTEQASNESLDMAFNKARADDRKTWIENYNKDIILDTNQTVVTYEEFINKELIHFSVYNLDRSVPSLCDGLKRSTRKIIYSCFKRKLTKEIKVAQLSGYVSEHSAYHHGEASLQEAIIGMAQNFVGSNNINLLMPNGQFGTRISGGKDSASPRYIHTQLNAPLVFSIFNPTDNDILTYMEDDGVSIEPEYYLPIIPMVLVNGASGIGTGFSTAIPCYNPVDIITNIRKLILGQDDLIDMQPYYKGFTGVIKDGLSYGVYTRKDKTQIEVSELPIWYWIDDFKKDLDIYMDKNPKVLKDVASFYTEDKVSFVLTFHSEEITDSMFEFIPRKSKDSKLLTKFQSDFKMTSSKALHTTNMHLFDSNGVIKKYDDVTQILKDFFVVRLKAYKDRKNHLIDKMEADITFVSAKVKFILETIDGELKILNVKKSDLVTHLQENNYPLIDDSFDYLIKMPIHNLTYEKKEELLKNKADKEDALLTLKNTPEKDLWLGELEELEKLYQAYINKEIEEKAKDDVKEKATGKGKGKGKQKI